MSFLQVMGMPQSEMCEMTGHIKPERRTELWEKKKMFFLTPQVLCNDMKVIICLPLPRQDILSKYSGRASLTKVDSVSRGWWGTSLTGKLFILYCGSGDRKWNEIFSSACFERDPGIWHPIYPASLCKDLLLAAFWLKNLKVISNLLISKIEMRTEDDLAKYSHGKEVEVIEIPPSPILNCVRFVFTYHLAVSILIDFSEKRTNHFWTFLCNTYAISTHTTIAMPISAASLCYWNLGNAFEVIRLHRFVLIPSLAYI